MAEQIRSAAVLGAGVMGTGIAGHLAGAGVKTHLLDIVPRDLDDRANRHPAARNRLALSAIEQARKARPAPFFDPSVTRLLIPGNFDDHLDRLADCDLVIEAVVENLEIKRALFARVADVLGPGALLASNTSGLSIAEMGAELPEALRQRFVVMHFFNPVRYMHLLEIVAGPDTTAETVQRATTIGERLGKGVVYGKDTTNFIANRVGTYGLMKVVHLMTELGLSIEEVDKIVGQPMGRPKSAAFKTADMVGLDTLIHVAKNCYDSLKDDPERDVFMVPDWITELAERGHLGRKSGAGFYKKEGSEIKVLDLEQRSYRSQKKVRFDSIGATRNIEDPGARLKAMISADDAAAQFAWKALSHALGYAARLIPEISDDVVQIDRAMRWGYNWDLGPFEAWDAIGVAEATDRMQKDGLTVPPSVTRMLESGRARFYEGPPSSRTYFDVLNQKAVPIPTDPRNLNLDAIREDAARVVRKNLGATLLDLGDGVACLEVHTKLNTIDDDVTKMFAMAPELVEKDFDALVIGNQGEHFGAGANLMLVYMGAQQQQWDMIDRAVQSLQNALQALRYAQIPVVAAPFQYTLGGGAEIAMAADACQAHAETYMGLVEVGVGLVPGGGGFLRMLERWTGDVQDVEGVDLLSLLGAASLNIATAKVATGAEEAQRLRYLLPSDGISLHRGFHLCEAKHRALGMAKAGYRPPRPRVFKAAGVDARDTIGMQIWGLMEGGYASEHDGLIARKVAHILCGGDVTPNTEITEQHILDLEREAFLSLCGEEKSQARMQSMLMTNKPLRN